MVSRVNESIQIDYIMNLKIFIAIMLAICFAEVTQAQPISKYLIGNNAWYETGLGGLWGRMSDAKFQTIRVGGNGAENYSPTSNLFLDLTRGIRTSGAEAIVQIPKTYSNDNVRALVNFLNVTHGLNVKIWGIGNEPDHSNKPASADSVSRYIRRISTVLKSIDPEFIVMGPATAAFSESTYFNRLVGGDLDITGMNANGHYYIDVYTWHRYMFVDINALEANVNTFLSRVAPINANRPSNKQLRWGMSEFNTSWNNDNNTSEDLNVWSFRAGQTFAEVYGLGMRKGAYNLNAWSMYEGQNERRGTDLSLFDKDVARSGRSNYYHSLMLGQNMKDNYIAPTHNQPEVTVIPMRDETGVSVMILNKGKTTGFDYTMRLNTSSVTTSNRLNINVPAGINAEIYGYIPQEATHMLVFDNAGNLIKRYIYTALDAAARRAPVVQTANFCNTPPVFSVIPDQTVSVGNGSFYVNVAGISDGNKNTQHLEVTATSSNSSVVRVNSVSYTLRNSSAFLLLEPLTNGNAVITVKVKELNNTCAVDSVVGSFRISSLMPFAIPGIIEAEAYHQMQGIQTQATTDIGGGMNVGFTDAGDWLEYYVKVDKTSTYDINFRLSSFPSNNVTAVFNLVNVTNNNENIATINVPRTTGWQNWITHTVRRDLQAGGHLFRINVVTGGFNFNWMEYIDITTSTNNVVATDARIGIKQTDTQVVFDLSKIGEFENTTYLRIFNSEGQMLKNISLNGVDKSAFVSKMEFSKGIYIISVTTDNDIINQKFILN